MTKKTFLTLAFLIVSGFIIAQNTLIRKPDICPDASIIAFGHHGDIWIHDFNSIQPKR